MAKRVTVADIARKIDRIRLTFPDIAYESWGRGSTVRICNLTESKNYSNVGPPREVKNWLDGFETALDLLVDQGQIKRVPKVVDEFVIDKPLAEWLNEKEIIPQVSCGVVTLTINDEECSDVTARVTGKGYVDAHPEGADRGGYDPYWERNGEVVHFHEVWQEVTHR